MNHLTDEQLAEWLAGESGEETRAHLRCCASCNTEAINLRDSVLRYSMSLRQRSARAQSAQMTGNFAPGKTLARHRLRWVGATVLALLLAAQTAWMMKPHTVSQTTGPVANSQPNSQPSSQSGNQMSDDELLEAVNNDLSRDVPQALAPVEAITAARNQIAAETSTSNESSR
jgi:4-amino-4-deoxy-L-arabinose transferase-like glycosyltransferase